MIHHRHSCPQQLSKHKTRGASLERDGVEGGERNRDDNEDGWDRRRQIDDNDSRDNPEYLGGCNCHPPRGRLSIKATGVFVRRHCNAIILLLLVALFLCLPRLIQTTPPVVLLQHNESSRQTKPQTAALSSLPKWVTGTPEDFAFEMTKGSRGLTDKVDERHLFQYIYQPNLARLIRKKLDAAKSLSHSPLTAAKPKIRMLEFGLGCAPGGGMIRGSPGGSAFGWRHLFDQVEGIDFELYIFELDRDCMLKWHNANPNIAEIHIGDATSEKDLMRAFEKSGGIPFDVIIDDASHINWHQIKTLDFMLPKVALGGLYMVEDIQSSCRDWKANMGSHKGDTVGGTKKCMSTNDGNTTILAHLIEYQRHLIGQYDGFKEKREFLKGVTRIEMCVNSALLSKEVQHASD
ncbi:hypothetical protein ACHAWF_017719 [Thalassiosira exigua]